MGDSRLATVRIDVPEKGVSFANPRYIQNGGAAKLVNIRVNQLFAKSRQGSVPLLDTPNARPVIDMFNLTFPNGNTETLRMTADAIYRANLGTGTWDQINGSTWTGTDKNRFWAVIAPFAGEDQGRIIIGNGIDVIRTWQGGTADTADYDGSVPAKYGIVNHDFVLLTADTLESGERQRQRLRWTVPGLTSGGASDWTSLGSGFLDLKQTPWPITGMWKQFGQTYIGLSRGVFSITDTGDPLNPYLPQLLNEGEGLFFSRSLVQYGNVAAMMTHQAISTWNGSTFEAIDGPVNREWKKRINYGALDQVTSVFDAENARVGWGLPLDGSIFPSEIWWVDLLSGRWETDNLAHTCISTFSGSFAGTTIDELSPNTIDDLAGTTIDDLSSGSSVPNPRVCYGVTNGETFLFDPDVSDDAGSQISGVFVSPAIPLIDQPISVAGKPRQITEHDYLVLDGVRIELLDRGANYTLAVDASGDGGFTWRTVGTVSLTTAGGGDRQIEVTTRGRVPLRNTVQIRVKNLTFGEPWGFSGMVALVDVVGRKVG